MSSTQVSQSLKQKSNIPAPLKLDNNHHIRVLPSNPKLPRPPVPPRPPSCLWPIALDQTPATPLDVAPFIQTKSTRPLKSLLGVTCCFCEESLEHTLLGEKIVVLECTHICHYECLIELIEISIEAWVDENVEKDMPNCPTCGEPSVPLDETMRKDIMEKAQSLPQTPASAGTSLTGVTSPLAKFSPTLWSPFPISPLNKNKLSTISATSSKSQNSHFSQSSMSSINSPDFQLLPVIKEIAPAIPTPLLETRIEHLPEARIQVSQETCVLLEKSLDSDVTITSAVTISFPKLPLKPNAATFEEREKLACLIQNSIKDWKNLDFTKFGQLRLCDSCHISRDLCSWKLLQCYLFDTMLIFVRQYPDKPPQLKGSVALKQHLKSILISTTNKNQLILNLSTVDLPILHVEMKSRTIIENWYSALVDSTILFPMSRLMPQTENENIIPTSIRLPIDLVILVPLSGSPQGLKFPAIRRTVLKVLAQMNSFDRMALVPYGGNDYIMQTHTYDLAPNTWNRWPQIVSSLNPSLTRLGSSTKAELLNTMTLALNILSNRSTSNPISSIFVISDSCAEISESALDVLASQSIAQEVSVHTFGVSNQSVDTLAALASRCDGGQYWYLRQWDDLKISLPEQFDCLQKIVHKHLALAIMPENDVCVVESTGNHAKRMIPASTTTFQSRPMTPLQETHTILELGEIVISQKRACLVTVRVPSDELKEGQTKKLFCASVCSRGISKKKSILGFSKLSPPIPDDCSTHKCEFGNVTFCTSNDKHQRTNSMVEAWKLQILVTNILESVVKSDLRNSYCLDSCITRLESGIEEIKSSSIHESQLQQWYLKKLLTVTMKEMQKTVTIFEEHQKKIVYEAISLLKSERYYRRNIGEFLELDN